MLPRRKVVLVGNHPPHPTRGRQGRRLSVWAHHLLRLYPRAWRERYADEVAAVLKAYDVMPRTVLDLLVGALDAHVYRAMVARRRTSRRQRIRSSELAIFVAFVLFSLAWLPLHFVSDTPPVWYAATLAHPELGVALGALDLAGLLGLFAVLVGGVWLVLAALRRALMLHRWGVVLLFAVPLAAASAFVVAALLLAPAAHVSLTGGTPTPVTAHAVDVRLGLSLAGLLACGVSVTALAVALKRSDLSPHAVRLAFIPAGLATGAMAVGVVAGSGLIALIVREARELGAWPPLEALILLLLISAAALARGAFWRGFRELRTTQAR
jgi:hypothetical protein